MKQSVVMRRVRVLSFLAMLVASSVIWAQGRGGGRNAAVPAARPSYTNWEQYEAVQALPSTRPSASSTDPMSPTYWSCGRTRPGGTPPSTQLSWMG